MDSSESARNIYLETIARLEPEIAMVDRDAALASIGVSLRRIADSLDGFGKLFSTLTRPPLYRVKEDGGVEEVTNSAGPLWRKDPT